MSSTGEEDIFGAVRMGYIVIGSRRLREWRDFATSAIGLHLAADSPDCLAFRLDRHARRLIIEDSEYEDVQAIGWQLEDEHVLEAVLARLENRGVRPEQVNGRGAEARGVRALHRFTGPKGLLIELFTQPILDSSPLEMLASGFVAEAGGMGHVSLMSRDAERSVEFWRELLDARVSDRIDLAVGSRPVVEVTFLRVNQRHHSIAIAATTRGAVDLFRTRIQHLNLEVETLDDLSGAYNRCKEMGCRVTRNIGQHPNDKELSFYVETPSGFELEVGWNALVVNEATWQHGNTYAEMSSWGHDVPGRFSSELSISQMLQGIRSLFRPEFFPW